LTRDYAVREIITPTYRKVQKPLTKGSGDGTFHSKAAGRTIPEPTPPLNEANYSGRFLMRVPRHLHAELARHAKRQGVSLNQYVLYLLAARQEANATGKTKRAA
jgi:hypothetical protein